MLAPPRRKEANPLLGQRHQIAIRLLHVAEAVLAQHLDDPLLRRIGIEHQIDFGLRLPGVAEGVVQQVVEDFAVQFRLAAIVGQERLERRPLFVGRIAHPQRELGQILVPLGQQMRLQVEHDLQPVLDLPQERVVLFEDRPLLVRQAAGPIQLGQGFQRVAGSQLGQIAAVEQLQELDGELDVADAAAAGLHVAGAAAVRMRKNGDGLRAGSRKPRGNVASGEVGPVPVRSLPPCDACSIRRFSALMPLMSAWLR